MTPPKPLAPIPTLCLCIAAGCTWPQQPEVGELRAGLCKPEDSDPQREVSFAVDIQPLFQRATAGCACHLSDPAQGGSAIDRSGLDLGDYQSLIRGGHETGPELIQAYAPCDSILLQKLGPAPPFGNRMPEDGPPYWSHRERTLLADWIAEGARNN